MITHVAWIMRRRKDEPIDLDKPLIQRNEEGRINWTAWRNFLEKNHLEPSGITVEIYPRSLKHRYIIGMIHAYQKAYTMNVPGGVMSDRKLVRIKAGPWRRRLILYIGHHKRPAAGMYKLLDTGLLLRI